MAVVLDSVVEQAGGATLDGVVVNQGVAAYTASTTVLISGLV
jgi:hypothetical protein